MYEISCASCSAPFEYNPDDYIHLCPFCSSGFVLDVEADAKDLISGHFIITNTMDQEQVSERFFNWISKRHHRPDKIKKEFNIIGSYCIYLPFWIVSAEVHTFWSGHSLKAHSYPGQNRDYKSKFLREEGHFTKRYRWCILGRKSTKEHWGFERLHQPKENVLVDWDGFPLDETVGKAFEGKKSLYDSKQAFKFEVTGGQTIANIQTKETDAIAKAKDQINEYHRRICKTKAGTLYEHRTEIDVVGIHAMHIPFWVGRYSYLPKGPMKFIMPARERKFIIQGYTQHILDAELPIQNKDKIVLNLFLCSGLGLASLGLSLFISPIFYTAFLIFLFVGLLSAWKLIQKEKPDIEVFKGVENKEPAN